jgi:hypothetical protein
MSYRRVVSAAVFAMFFVVAGVRSEVPVAGSLDKPPTKPASENPCLKYLPDDAFAIGNIDIKQIVTWAGAQKNPNMAVITLKQYLVAAQTITGIDPETEVEYLTFYVTGDPAREWNFLIAVSGQFVTATIEKQMAAQFDQAEITRVGGKNLYTLPSSAFAFPEGGMLLIGSPDLVKAAIAKARGKANLPAALDATLKQTDAESVLWLALKPKTLIDLAELEPFRKDNADLVAKLGALDFISLSAKEAKDGYQLTATAALPDKEKAAAFAEFLADRKKGALTTEGVNAFYLPLLLASELETKDAHVRASLRLTKTALQEIWDTKVILKK